MSELTVPKEWAKINISEIADVDLGKTPKKKDYRSDGLYKVVKFRDVDYKGIDWSKNKDGFVPEDTTKDLRKLELDDVLITASAHSSEHIGRKICFVSKIPKDYKNVFYCGELLGIRAYKDILSPKFTFLYFLSHSGYKEIQSRVKGVHLTSGQARNMTIPFAPYEEQGQIIEIVEQLFSDLDNAIENLQKAKNQLNVYRQSVLKYAFEGRLTEEYRKHNKLSNNDWRDMSIDEVGEIVTGTTPSKKESKYYGCGHPFYKPGDLDAGYLTNCSADNLSDLGIKKARLLPAKSVLVTCIGATIGKTGLIRKSGACNQQINAIIPNKSVISEYVYYFAISPWFQGQIKKTSSSTTLPILNKTKFQRLRIKVPLVDEQKQIVQEIESRFSICDKMEETIENSLNQTEALRQSILKQAFEGKLTEEWRKEHQELISGENSAKALLERIKAEREALGNTQKRKK